MEAKPKSKTSNTQTQSPLVEVSDQEIRIDFTPDAKCRATVRLKSLCGTHPVAFKVQTSSPHKFMVNPPAGLIPPLSSATFQVILKPQSHLPNPFPRSPSDRFLIKTAQFPPGQQGQPAQPNAVISWFASRPGNRPTQDHRLKTAFVGRFLLRHAVAAGDHDAARNLIKRQKSLLSELGARDSEVLLRVASELGSPETMVKLLLESGLRIGGGDREEGKAQAHARGAHELHVAAAFDRAEEVKGMVVVRGGGGGRSGSLDCGDKKGRTALHVAAGKGRIGCARVLMESGADKDARSRDGRTSLHRAAAKGDSPMVEMLVQSGADPTIVDDRGRSPLDVARDKGHPKVVEILERGEAVLMSARCGDTKRLESLLKSGAAVNFRDQQGLSALHAAAMKGQKNAVVMLIEFGLDVESRDSQGHSALHLAIVGGSLEAVTTLVAKGANVNVKSRTNVSPLYMATAMGHHHIAEFLISKGASSSSSFKK